MEFGFVTGIDFPEAILDGAREDSIGYRDKVKDG